MPPPPPILFILRQRSVRKYSLYLSTFPFSSTQAKPQEQVFSLSPLYLPSHPLSPAVTARSHGKHRNLKGNQSSSSQLGGGSRAHPYGPKKGRGPNWSYNTTSLGREAGLEKRPQVFLFRVFFLFYFTTLPPPRQLKVVTLALANSVREHPGQGASLSEAAGGREGTD